MKWSVSIVADGDREMTIDEIVELADAVAASNGIASGVGTTSYGAQLVVDAGSSDEAAELAIVGVHAGRGASGAPGMACVASRDDRRGRCPRRPGGRVIRLGSLAGYPFEGPRVLAGWTPPAVAAVYAVLVRPEAGAKGEEYAVIYVDHSDDLSTERFPFNHPRAGCWVRRAGDRFKLCDLHVRGAGRPALSSRADRA